MLQIIYKIALTLILKKRVYCYIRDSNIPIYFLLEVFEAFSLSHTRAKEVNLQYIKGLDVTKGVTKRVTNFFSLSHF